MADFITGREIILAVKKASDWRTAVACGASDGVLIKTDGMGAKAPTYIPDDSLGNSDLEYEYRTNEEQTGNVAGILRYEGWDVLLALSLGTAGSPANLSGSAYSNTYSPADSIADDFATIALKKSATTNNIWEIPSAKITGFTITGKIGELCQITVNEMGNKVENQSAINTNASIASVTYPDKGNAVKMDARTLIRMNTQSGSALADSDIIYPSEFEVTYNRPFESDFEAGFSDASEPVQNGFAEATIKLVFDKYNSDTFMDAIAADTDQKMELHLEGAEIETNYRYTFRFEFPKITWKTADAPVTGPGKIPQTVEGTLLKVSSAPTGMTTTDPLSIYVQNTRSTDPLS